MLVKDAMSAEVISIREDVPLNRAAQVLCEERISGAPVVNDNGELVGMLSQADLLPKLKGVPFAKIELPTLVGEWYDAAEFESAVRAAGNRTVGEVMTKRPITIESEETIASAAELLSRANIKRLPVTRNGQLVGIITRSDIVRLFLKAVEALD
ncbi:MAG: CBS domain-containing protein [Bdellovibrionales bacterium]|nr:CBS domain-containing protein [Bdellovibrionales bacterium]